MIFVTGACVDRSEYEAEGASAKQDICLAEPWQTFCVSPSAASAETSYSSAPAAPTTTTTVPPAYDYGLENSRMACGTFREAARRTVNKTMDWDEFAAEVWDASSLAQDATSDGSGGLPVPGSRWLPLFEAFVDMNVAIREQDRDAFVAASQQLSSMCAAIAST